ncbi:MAG: hypothetical protein HDQ88_09045 [Clostridia bacterium]|nr:hypothetical protein [Clostridia bacterium]
MNLEQLFLKRQSTREFSDKEVPDEALEKICRLATLAPSAINAQPWNLYAVNGAKAKEFTKYVQKDGANGWADGAKAYIAIEQREPHAIMRGERRVSNEEFIPNDIGILTAYIALAAEDLGVQTCIIGLRDEKGIAEFLGLPNGTHFPLVIALGYCADGYPVREKRRREFEKNYKLIK